MKTPVLIVTPDPKLGELISNSLAETFQYDAHCFAEPKAAGDFLRTLRNCEHVLIETTLGEQGVLQIGRLARSLKHNIKIVLISRNQPPAAFDELRPWRLLRQPFLVPDLFNVLDAAPPTIIDGKTGSARGVSRRTWLEDRTLAARTLQHLAVETDAQEVMILRENDLWAAAGKLKDSAVSEIMKTILNSLESGDQFDLLRFMRLTNQKAQHGVWARLLMVNVILAAIYDADASINEMRTQTNALADALFRPLLSGPSQTAHPELPPGKGLLGLTTKSKSGLTIFHSPGPAVARPALQPDPQVEWNRLAVNPAGTGEVGEEFGDEPVHDEAGRVWGTRRARASRSESGLTQSEESPTTSRPRSELRDPGPFDQYSVTYSCLLTPRFASHPLGSELKDLLQDKLRQICISYGWGLGRVEVLPDCLHWTVMVPPTEPVADHIQMVRRMTSACVFEDYPQYAQENLSHDFWAPGYSLLTGSQPHTPSQIAAYVRNRRQRSAGGAGGSPETLWGSPSIVEGE